MCSIYTHYICTSATKDIYIHPPLTTVKWVNFDRRGNFDGSGSFVKLATVLIQECLFVASALMEIND